MPEIELTSLRAINSKTFDLGNRQRRLVASIGAVHYKDNYTDPGEAWKDIDLTPDANGNTTKAPYELTRDGNRYSFKDKQTGEIATIERTSVFPPGIPFEIIPEFSAVRFRHVLPNNKVPFEAQFKVTGRSPVTRAFDDDGELELDTTFVDGVLTEKLLQIKDKRTGLIRPATGQIKVDPTLNLQVGASADDCFVYIDFIDGEWVWQGTYNADPNFGVGNNGGNARRYGGGIRFLNVTIPVGATITAASLTFRADISVSGTTVNSRIVGNLQTAPTSWGTLADYQARRGTDAGGGNNTKRTVASVTWDSIAAWTINTDYTSPDISTVIQEIVNQAGWASGNNLALWFDDHENRSNSGAGCYRRVYTYDGSTTYAPKLDITYTVAAPKSGNLAQKLVAAGGI